MLFLKLAAAQKLFVQGNIRNGMRSTKPNRFIQIAAETRKAMKVIKNVWRCDNNNKNSYKLPSAHSALPVPCCDFLQQQLTASDYQIPVMWQRLVN